MGMLGFLKSYKELSLAVLLCFAVVILCMLRVHVSIPLITFLLALWLFLDERVKRILDEQTSYVYGIKQARNVDYLIVGDMADIRDICEEGKKIVCIMSPNRSLECSFWILKRMFSLLDEKAGKAIIIVKKENIKKQGVTLFEYSFLSPVYRNILKVSYLEKQRKHPFFYSPIRSFLLVCGIKHKSVKTGCLDNNIEEFCRVRGINVEYRLIR